MAVSIVPVTLACDNLAFGFHSSCRMLATRVPSISIRRCTCVAASFGSESLQWSAVRCACKWNHQGRACVHQPWECFQPSHFFCFLDVPLWFQLWRAWSVSVRSSPTFLQLSLESMNTLTRQPSRRYVHSRTPRDDKPTLKCFKLRKKPLVFRIQVPFLTEYALSLFCVALFCGWKLCAGQGLGCVSVYRDGVALRW